MFLPSVSERIDVPVDGGQEGSRDRIEAAFHEQVVGAAQETEVKQLRAVEKYRKCLSIVRTKSPWHTHDRWHREAAENVVRFC